MRGGVQAKGEIRSKGVRTLFLVAGRRGGDFLFLKRLLTPFELPQHAPGQTTYGRTALIYCNGEPAVELLEIVTPD